MSETHPAQWLMPDYYPAFQCKCGACRNLCCTGWEIDLSMRDYYRLLGMDCTADLRRRLDTAFISPDDPSEQRFRKIVPNYFGQCPFLNQDKLCSLQVEFGPETIPEVCRVYPRSLRTINGVRYACCSASCEAVTELLFRDCPLSFITGSLAEAAEMTDTAPEDMPSVRAASLSIIQSRNLPLDDRILSICRSLHPGFHGVPYNMILEETDAFTEVSENIRPFLETAVRRYRADLSALQGDNDCLLRYFPSWEQWAENLMVNHLAYCGFPYADERIAKTDVVYGLHAAYRLTELIAAATVHEGMTRDDLVDAVSAAFHLIEHTAFYFNCKVLFNNRI